MKKILLSLLGLVLFLWTPAIGQQSTANSLNETTSAASPHQATIDKIMDSLNLGSKARSKKVRAIIQNHYSALAKVIDKRTEEDQSARTTYASDKAASDAAVTAAWTTAKADIDRLHAGYLKKLQAELNETQLTKVKDVMTDHGLRQELERFHAMFPALTGEQKDTVRALITEARENAMNALNSRERHQWFAKYRGKANNYLAAKGYDLRKATEELKKKQGK